MKRQASSDGGGEGFTLLELLVVLAILSLVLGLISVSSSVRSQALVADASARAFAETLQTLRDQAVRGDRETGVTIDPIQGRYVSDPNNVTIQVPKGVTLQFKGPDGSSSSPVIRFFADGTSSGGIVRFSAGSRRIQVEDRWLTGRIIIDD